MPTGWRVQARKNLGPDSLKAHRNLIRWARHRAKKKGLSFDITVDDIVIPTLCPVLSIPLVHATDSPSENSPTLDRVDPSKGYIKGNVRVISHRANRLKGDAALSEIERVADYMREHMHASTYLHGDVYGYPKDLSGNTSGHA